MLVPDDVTQEGDIYVNLSKSCDLGRDVISPDMILQTLLSHDAGLSVEAWTARNGASHYKRIYRKMNRRTIYSKAIKLKLNPIHSEPIPL